MKARFPNQQAWTLVALWAAGAVGHARAQSWPEVPQVDFASLSPAHFADHELEVPYHLWHFARVANAVVETGPDRGFLALKVNREPVDNLPTNARVMENQLALAYFYTANRSWNPYFGHPAVRVRLEAMLARWARIQNQPGTIDGDFDGLWTEYGASNWSLAPTSFGVMHAAEAINLVRVSGLPFDGTVLDQAALALRRGLLAIFTRPDMRQHAREWSNQFSGAYHAALLQLEVRPDAELESALRRAIADAAAQDQSPAGFFYEQGGPDFGYTQVHENNLRIALPRLGARPELLGIIAEEDIAWNEWLAATLVLQPGSNPRLFLTPAGLNTRTSHAFQTPRSRPLAQWAEPSRSFAFTVDEHAAAVAARRNQLQGEFGRWGALAVPSAYSYIPGFAFDAVRPLNTWHPTPAQRDVADASLPSRSDSPRTLQFHDPWPVTVTSLRRAGYYAVATSGRIRTPRQVYGLGLLWHPRFGVALQSVADAPASATWSYGTRRSGISGGATYETGDLAATHAVAGTTVVPRDGAHPLPPGDFHLTYPLETVGQRAGTKTLRFAATRIEVEISHSGVFTELLPLAMASEASLVTGSSFVEWKRPDGSSFSIALLTPGSSLAVGAPVAFATSMVRRAVTISASGNLTYRLSFDPADAVDSVATSPTPDSPPAATSRSDGGGGGAASMPGLILLVWLLVFRAALGRFVRVAPPRAKP